MQPEAEWDPELKEKVKEAYHDTFDLEAARQAAIQRLPNNHAWKQQGPTILCDSCHPTHVYIAGPLKSLTRDEEGSYILVDRF